GNLTNQVRGIAKVVTAVANGDLKQKLLVEAKGEIAALADTINSMTDTLAIFADQTTTVAREVGVEGKLGGQAHVPGAAGTWRDLTDNVNQLAANLTTQLRAIADVATAVTKGDLTRSIQVAAQGEVAFVKDNINEMIRNLKDTTQRNNEQDWLKTNLAKFTRMLQGQKDLLTVGRLILSELAPVVSAQQGVFYIMDTGSSDPELKLLASYAFRERKGVSNRFKLGEGLVGQAALEKERILLTQVPEDYVRISSGLGESTPKNIVVLPIVFEGQVKAVMELSSFDRFNPTHQTFLDQLTESIGIVLNTIEANMRTEDLLKQSQSLAGELQSRQLELQATNQELEEKARQLFEQNAEVERKNVEVEQARQALEGKAEQLALTSKYKSEFLANMSHELRTPLNSLLILADQLAVNPDGNLTAKQVEFARTIRGSGKDLLKLINDILDLSKIESGTVNVDVSDVRLNDLRANMERTFRHVAADKGVEFQIDIDPNLPPAIFTDEQRLEQILKNLLSNAFKFTERGFVKFAITSATSGWSADCAALNRARIALVFTVADSGIGIAPEKHAAIFEAFQQADGSTSRKYGGTGLGLAISRELARLLGGEIRLESEEKRGSRFTLYLPQSTVGFPGEKAVSAPPVSTIPAWQVLPEAPFPPPAPAGALPPPSFTDLSLPDDRAHVQPNDRSVLIVEDDRNFASLLMDVAHENGFKAIVTSRGHSALALIREHKPSAVTLDISLPDINGWKVLDRIKGDLSTRHIPVFIVSVDDEPHNILRQGAICFLSKPATHEDITTIFTRTTKLLIKKSRDVLIVEDDENQRNSMIELIGNSTAVSTGVGTAGEALALLEDKRFDCVVVDLLLPDMSGFDLIEQIREKYEYLPIIVYTGKELSAEEEAKLNRFAQTVIVKDVRSPERLYDYTALWLHRDVSQLPVDKRQLLQRLHDPNALLTGKRVLIVDDDIRNIFAMTSLLERYQMVVVSAETGQAAIEILRTSPGIEIVLMDIMLPQKDGYETMREIRAMYGFELLPIIAVTAKAMKGDREKCIDAGASDYLSKPVDTERLLTLLRTWLHR
ncbi:MAG: response regulator, partial [Verrucomicrobiota bacterium]